MAVVASVYKSSSDRHFPDILLLDEVDASLHPSMIQNLIDVVQDIFLKNGVRVLLVTHSPTTIALSSESSVFVMNRGGVQRIEKRSRRDALEILTEGFATLEEGIRILDEVARTPVSVLTEGRNVSFIRAALDHAAIDGVDVVSGVEGSSGSGQLRTLYDLFTAVPHENKVIIVWDCDANSYRKLPSKNRTFPFVFEPNPNNNVARAGVENLFSQDLVEPFAMRTERPNGEVQVRFDGAEKVRFEEHVIERGNQGDFVRFEPLMNLIREVSAG